MQFAVSRNFSQLLQRKKPELLLDLFEFLENTMHLDLGIQWPRLSWQYFERAGRRHDGLSLQKYRSICYACKGD
jgi:hypothetical protein